jgi:hypothetical protein
MGRFTDAIERLTGQTVAAFMSRLAWSRCFHDCLETVERTPE